MLQAELAHALTGPMKQLGLPVVLLGATHQLAEAVQCSGFLVSTSAGCGLLGLGCGAGWLAGWVQAAVRVDPLGQSRSVGGLLGLRSSRLLGSLLPSCRPPCPPLCLHTLLRATLLSTHASGVWQTCVQVWG